MRKACSGLQEAAFQMPPELARGCCSIRGVLNLPLKGREGFCGQVGFGRTRDTWDEEYSKPRGPEGDGGRDRADYTRQKEREQERKQEHT